MEYTMEWAGEQKPFDEVVEHDGARVLIDPKAVMYLLGTEMDYVTDKLSSQFVFSNPNQTGSCGCGESVNLAPASKDKLEAWGRRALLASVVSAIGPTACSGALWVTRLTRAADTFHRASAASSLSRASTQCSVPSARQLLLPERRAGLEVVHQELGGGEGGLAVRRGGHDQHDVVAGRSVADAMHDQARLQRPARLAPRPRRALQLAARSCPDSARASCAAMALPSLSPRTVPVKVTMAPMSVRPCGQAPISAPTSKSSACTRTLIALASGHRREERDLARAGDAGGRPRRAAVERHADHLGSRKGLRIFGPRAFSQAMSCAARSATSAGTSRISSALPTFSRTQAK